MHRTPPVAAMPNNTNRALSVLDPPPSHEELLEASRTGLSLIAYRLAKAGALAPDDYGMARLEKQEQAECWKVFRAFGARVYSLSQARASKQTPGLGDGWVFLPRAGIAFWFEVKRQIGARQSPAQVEFQQLCEQCGIRYVIGGRREAWALLREVGLADETNQPVRDR